MSQPKVYEAICKITAELGQLGISKDRRNTQQNYQFRGIDDVYAALSPLLAKHHLCILPRVVDRTVSEKASKSGGVLFYTSVRVEYDLVCSDDGSKHTVACYGEAMDSGDKSTNKALSASFKYMAFQTFCIPVEGNDDADFTTHEVAPSTPRHVIKNEPLPEESKFPEEPKLVYQWTKAIEDLRTLAEFNDCLGRFKELDGLVSETGLKVVKGSLLNAARKHGCEFSRESKKFVPVQDEGGY